MRWDGAGTKVNFVQEITFEIIHFLALKIQIVHHREALEPLNKLLSV